MGERARLGLLSLVVATTAWACSSPPARQPAPGGSGGSAGGSATGGTPAGTGGQIAPPEPDASPADAPAPEAPAIDDAGAPPDTGGPEAAPDVTPAPTLGPFPLEAVKAAKAELYVAANAHLEGPTYRNGEIFFTADGAGWGMMRIDADRKLYRYHPTLQPVGSYLLADGSILWGEHTHVLMQLFPDGKVGVLTPQLDGKNIEFANDVTVDASGNIYTSSRRSGELFRITPAGEVARIASGLDVPNGVEIDPTSKYLYVGLGNAIVRYALPADGSANFGKFEMLASSGQPDGMQFDAWGNLWVAPWRTGHITVHAPDGKLLADVPSGGAPVNLTFGGPDGDTVFVATDFKGIYKIGPIKGLRGFLHPGAAKYTIKRMLDVAPANQPR